MYKLTILKFEENANYESELAKHKEKYSRGYFNEREIPPEPPKEVALRYLDVFLTEEEFKVVKKSVLDTFK